MDLPVTEYRIIKRCGFFMVQRKLGGKWTNVMDTGHDHLSVARRQRLMLESGDPSRPFEVIE